MSQGSQGEAARGVRVPAELQSAPHRKLEVRAANAPRAAPNCPRRTAAAARPTPPPANSQTHATRIHAPSQEYVRARLLQFAPLLAARLAAGAAPELLRAATADALAALPPPDYSAAPLAVRDLQLVFRHDCQSLGCLDPQCVLCEHNPHRRCSVNFSGEKREGGRGGLE
jgi:hypothetical protein